jgi:hypothetical protein
LDYRADFGAEVTENEDPAPGHSGGAIISPLVLLPLFTNTLRNVIIELCHTAGW